MAFNFKNLDQKTRELMLEEIALDINQGTLYYSKRFNAHGIDVYAELLKSSAIDGNEDSLAKSLNSAGCMNSMEERGTSGKLVKVPVNACQLLAEGEFNRYYIRALCLRALNEKNKLVVYRARASENPRPESLKLINKEMDPQDLLTDLRKNIGLDTLLGLPPGPNSGLSVFLQ